jgi:hypothetical protein
MDGLGFDYLARLARLGAGRARRHLAVVSLLLFFSSSFWFLNWLHSHRVARLGFYLYKYIIDASQFLR